jgi:hypothetical protein
LAGLCGRPFRLCLPPDRQESSLLLAQQTVGFAKLTWRSRFSSPAPAPSLVQQTVGFVKRCYWQPSRCRCIEVDLPRSGIANGTAVTSPPLLCMCVCVPQMAPFSRPDVTLRTKSGRRKPTVGNVTHPPVGNAHQQRHPFTRPEAAGVSQPCECDASVPFGQKRSPLQVRLSNPQRADTRRSYERAFVHRECRHF